MRTLTQLELNRSLLDRQSLLERSRENVLDVLKRVGGLQSQAPDPPYIGLWSRLVHFSAPDLETLLAERKAVRLALMRSTIHLVAAEDAWMLRALVQPAVDRLLNTGYARDLVGIDPDEVRALTREFLARGAATPADISATLQQQFPDRNPAALSNAARTWLPLVQPPPRGFWKAGGPSLHLPLENWIPPSTGPLPGPEALVERYLEGFGPASVKDIQAWSGLTGLGPVVKKMSEQLVKYRDESGRELIDLPNQQLPDPSVYAPVRFLPEWDTAILGFADRSRILPAHYLERIYTKNGIFKPTVLVDGFVAGLWKITRNAASDIAQLDVELFEPIDRKIKSEIEREGEQLLAFVEPQARAIEVNVDQ